MNLDPLRAERNRLVAVLAAIWPAHRYAVMGGWSIVCVHTPAGQATWHVPDRQLDQFGHVPCDGQDDWDGHTVDEKYQRLATLTARGTGGA